MLEEAEYIFIVDQNLMVLNAVYLNIILASNVQGDCKSKFIIDQSYSTKFLGSLSEVVSRSGSPGYLIGYRLLIGYNITDSSGNNIFQVPDEGLYMTGSQQDHSCKYRNSPSDFKKVESTFDSPINYRENTIYSCNLNFNLSQFENFCTNKKWKNLKIYDFPTLIQYVGIFGNANAQFTTVINYINI